MSELKPCPFCRSADVVIQKDVHGNLLWWAVCLQCDTSSGAFDSVDKAIAAWNTRAESPELAATRRLVRDMFELALEWKARDCAYKDPDARYCELKQRAIELGLLEGSKV